MGVIYKITNPNGRIYVGKTWNLKRRISDYKYKLNGRTSIVINSIKKYGWDNHKLEIIEDNVLDEKLNEREIFWIAKLKTYNFYYPDGMNLTKGGEGQRSTWMHDLERRKYMSELFKGEKAPFYGKKHTEETKKIISEKAKISSKIIGREIPKWGAEKSHEKSRKPVVCYNHKGEFLREFISTNEASQILGVNRASVSESCHSKITGVEGKYIFKFKTENYPLLIESVEIKRKGEKRPVLLIQKNKIVEYPSALEASIDLGVPKGTINRAAQYNNGKPIRKGFIFVYKDIYEGE